MRKLIGAGEMPAFLPVLLSVSLTISSRILLKSWNFWPGMCRNSPHSSTLLAASEVSILLSPPFGSPFSLVEDAARLMSWRTRGRRVTMPVPRGRKSRPTMFSSTDDLPLDCEPTTTIWGRSMGFWTPTVVKTSCSLLTRVMRPGSFTLILR